MKKTPTFSRGDYVLAVVRAVELEQRVGCTLRRLLRVVDVGDGLSSGIIEVGLTLW